MADFRVVIFGALWISLLTCYSHPAHSRVRKQAQNLPIAEDELHLNTEKFRDREILPPPQDKGSQVSDSEAATLWNQNASVTGNQNILDVGKQQASESTSTYAAAAESQQFNEFDSKSAGVSLEAISLYQPHDQPGLTPQTPRMLPVTPDENHSLSPPSAADKVLFNLNIEHDVKPEDNDQSVSDQYIRNNTEQEVAKTNSSNTGDDRINSASRQVQTQLEGQHNGEDSPANSNNHTEEHRGNEFDAEKFANVSSSSNGNFLLDNNEIMGARRTKINGSNLGQVSRTEHQPFLLDMGLPVQRDGADIGDIGQYSSSVPTRWVNPEDHQPFLLDMGQPIQRHGNFGADTGTTRHYSSSVPTRRVIPEEHQSFLLDLGLPVVKDENVGVGIVDTGQHSSSVPTRESVEEIGHHENETGNQEATSNELNGHLGDPSGTVNHEHKGQQLQNPGGPNGLETVVDGYINKENNEHEIYVLSMNTENAVTPSRVIGFDQTKEPILTAHPTQVVPTLVSIQGQIKNEGRHTQLFSSLTTEDDVNINTGPDDERDRLTKQHADMDNIKGSGEGNVEECEGVLNENQKTLLPNNPGKVIEKCEAGKAVPAVQATFIKLSMDQNTYNSAENVVTLQKHLYISIEASGSILISNTELNYDQFSTVPTSSKILFLSEVIPYYSSQFSRAAASDFPFNEGRQSVGLHSFSQQNLISPTKTVADTSLVEESPSITYSLSAVFSNSKLNNSKDTTSLIPPNRVNCALSSCLEATHLLSVNAQSISDFITPSTSSSKSTAYQNTEVKVHYMQANITALPEVATESLGSEIFRRPAMMTKPLFASFGFMTTTTATSGTEQLKVTSMEEVSNRQTTKYPSLSLTGSMVTGISSRSLTPERVTNAIHLVTLVQNSSTGTSTNKTNILVPVPTFLPAVNKKTTSDSFRSTTKKRVTSKEKLENSSVPVVSTRSISTQPAFPSPGITPARSKTSQIPNVSTQPLVYIQIKLHMSLIDFNKEKKDFITDLKSIMEKLKGLKIMDEQFKIPDLKTQYYSGDIWVQMYIVDKEGKVDITLTMDASSVIEQGFQASESKFKDKILIVKFEDQRTIEKPEYGPSGITLVIVLASVGGACCVILILLQVVILLYRRVKAKKQVFHGQKASLQSMDHVALGIIPKSQPNSECWKTAFDVNLELVKPDPYSHTMSFSSLANFCMDVKAIDQEFQAIPFNDVIHSVTIGYEDKNRFADVLPYKHNRVKLKQIAGCSSDYINASFIDGYMGQKNVYIVTQSPMENTVEDFWKMVWEQQSRAILMLNPVLPNGKPKESSSYWPENEKNNHRQQYGDYTVTLMKRKVEQDYIDTTFEIMDIERNLKRQLHHYWLTCWPEEGVPEPLSIVKFVLDTRPCYDNGTSPVIVHCGPGAGRSCTLIAVDICMRMFEDARRVDIPSCVHKMRSERVGAVQAKEQYNLIYQALNEYAVVLRSPSVSTRSSVITLHAML